MGQGLSCVERADDRFLDAVEDGDVNLVRAMVEKDHSLLERTGGNGKHHPLHLAAANGWIEVGLFAFFLMGCDFLGKFF